MAREGHVDAEAARRARTQIERAFPEALVTGFEHLEPVMPNELGDRHVAAAATLIGAQVIVTANVRDFAGLPPQQEVQTPDVFLIHLFGLAPAVLSTVLEEIAADYRKPPQSVQTLLSRLAAVAPNFQVALAKRFPSNL